MQLSLGGLPEADIEKMLGLNALDAYDVDAEALRAIAARIGPAKAAFVREAAE